MADFTLSPGIVTNEIDASVRRPTVSLSSVGGVVGRFDWDAECGDLQHPPCQGAGW